MFIVDLFTWYYGAGNIAYGFLICVTIAANWGAIQGYYDIPEKGKAKCVSVDTVAGLFCGGLGGMAAAAVLPVLGTAVVLSLPAVSFITIKNAKKNYKERKKDREKQIEKDYKKVKKELETENVS